MRRRPNFTRFILVGAILGVLAAGILNLFGEDVSDRYTSTAVLGYLSVIFGVLGALGGAIVAVLLDPKD